MKAKRSAENSLVTPSGELLASHVPLHAAWMLAVVLGKMRIIPADMSMLHATI